VLKVQATSKTLIIAGIALPWRDIIFSFICAGVIAITLLALLAIGGGQ
jgi:hypothetical protein